MIAPIRWMSVSPGTGFGNASADYRRGLRAAGVPVTWTPLGWPSDLWQEPFGPLSGPVPADEGPTSPARWGPAHGGPARWGPPGPLVVHATPFWSDRLLEEAAGGPLVAYTTYEADRLPSEKVAALNRYAQVLVPSRFNRSTFRASGVTVPLHVVPHIARAGPTGPLAGSKWSAGCEGRYVFYTIGTWTVRKAILDTVAAYTTAFSAADPVVLVIHTTPEDQVAVARTLGRARPAARAETASWFTLARALAHRTDLPEIVLSTAELTGAEVDALHRRGDCFVSLSRGEGWGLGAFDAAAFGNPVVVTGWGGALDYLPGGYPYCVDYDLVPTCSDGPDAWWVPSPGGRWAKARTDHAALLLRHVFSHRDEARRWGATLQADVTTRFAQSAVTSRLLSCLAVAGRG